MYIIIPAIPADAEIICEIQMRAFAEEGRLSDNVQIPPLPKKSPLSNCTFARKPCSSPEMASGSLVLREVLLTGRRAPYVE